MAEMRELAPGDVLVRQGDDADEVFLVRSGCLVSERETDAPNGHSVLATGRLGAGSVAGEVPAIAGGQRTLTLRAAAPTVVLAVGREDFAAWLTRHPEAADALSADSRDRIDRSEAVEVVGELLGAAPDEALQEIVDRLTWRHLRAGETLFEQGDASDGAYVVVHGRLVASSTGADGTSVTLNEMGRGELVGEFGLLDHAPRSATVRAVRDTTLACFGTALFDELVEAWPRLVLHIARRLVDRLRRHEPAGRSGAGTIALVLTAPDLDAAAFVAGLAGGASRAGTVVHLSSQRVDELLGRPGSAQVAHDAVGGGRLAQVLHEAELTHDTVLLEADRSDSRWTQRAIEYADRVVLACSPTPRGEEDARLRAALDAAAARGGVRTLLAVVHPPGAALHRRGPATALTARVDDVVHVQAGRPEDLARLGRLATGTGVGVVLGGGGARGFAHLGALRALAEHGVPVDAVGGASIGAVIGGLAATGMAHDEIVDAVQHRFHRLLDYTLPIVSLVKGQRISEGIDAAFGGWAIEDLPLPYFCVSTNLTTASLEIHRRGDLARAVRASIAIPGILPPVPVDGDLLVDGGVLDNLPVGPMRAHPCVGTVIAVDVAPARGPRARGHDGSWVSGLRALGVGLRRGPSRYPSISTVLLQSMLVGSAARQRSSLVEGAVDLLLDLDVPRIGLLEFDRVHEGAELGHASASPLVAAWAAEAGWS